ncbi:UbiA-like polyprenyltransferase [Desulfococcaceae bacterium HSG8]|nr:UbiA-like polyprenyltransferase [Desulfococcaceae bacterium HSG8]
MKLSIPSGITDRILVYGRMIKFSHTLFALPFALSAVVLAHRRYPIYIADILWILLAMVGARSAAMGFNRIADARIDAKNPRTSNREIPAGKLSVNSARLFVFLSSGLFIFAAAMLGKMCFYLSFPVLVILFFYSYTKRFTWLAHLYLGFAISLAPLGAWLAIAKTFSWPILFLCSGLMTYIAGFDILYACQDTDFDKKEGLFSIPARFGIREALLIARVLHCCSFGSFILFFFAFNMHIIYLCTVFLIGLLFVAEHWLVRPDDLTHINIAFFHINSLISLFLFIGVLADELII